MHCQFMPQVICNIISSRQTQGLIACFVALIHVSCSPMLTLTSHISLPPPPQNKNNQKTHHPELMSPQDATALEDAAGLLREMRKDCLRSPGAASSKSNEYSEADESMEEDEDEDEDSPAGKEEEEDEQEEEETEIAQLLHHEKMKKQQFVVENHRSPTKSPQSTVSC